MQKKKSWTEPKRGWNSCTNICLMKNKRHACISWTHMFIFAIANTGTYIVEIDRIFFYKIFHLVKTTVLVLTKIWYVSKNRIQYRLTTKSLSSKWNFQFTIFLMSRKIEFSDEKDWNKGDNRQDFVRTKVFPYKVFGHFWTSAWFFVRTDRQIQNFYLCVRCHL